MSSRIIEFYSDRAADHRGRTRSQILNWDDKQLESVHDFIQWLFPLPEPSPVNPQAPTLDAATIEEFNSRPELRTRLRDSLQRMLRFYGLNLNEGTVELANNFEVRAWEWLVKNNHNHLRITRILRCCRLLGLAAESRAFLDCLERINQEHPGQITGTTLQFWRSATATTIK